MSSDEIPSSCSTCRSLQAEVASLRAENNNLKVEMKALKQTRSAEKRFNQQKVKKLREYMKHKQCTGCQHNAQLHKGLSNIFSAGQIKCLTTGKSATKWTKEDIVHALELRTVSRKAYKFLRTNKHVPLPGLSTLRRWVSGFACKPGMSQLALDLLSAKASRFTTAERLCVVSFDEMSVGQRLAYDVKEDQVIGPFSKALVFMIRGLMSKWKQPIYFDFDAKLTGDLIKSVINDVEGVGYHVVACVCDMAGGNRGLLTSLGVTETQPNFNNPSNPSKSVWCFADVPHLLKLLRNNFVDYGFELQDGTVINKDIIQKIIDKDASELKIVHKLTQQHLNAVGMERQKFGWQLN